MILKKRWMRIAAWTIAVLAVVVGAVTLVANSSYVKDRLIGLATDALSKELHTEVQIDDIGLNLVLQRASIYGITLKDQQQRDLFQAEKLSASLRLPTLLLGRLELKKCQAEGINLLLVKPEDGPANYQFLIDATQKKKGEAPKVEGGKKKAFKLSLRDATMRQLHVSYNGEDYSMEEAVYSHRFGKHSLTVRHLKGGMKKKTRKYKTDWHLDTGLLTATFKDDGPKHIDIKGLKLQSDNHRPRRNTGRKHRGAFDWGHMDLQADLDFDILQAAKDSVSIRLDQCAVKDTVAGFDLKVSGNIAVIGKEMDLTDVVVQQIDTRIDIAKAHFVLPSKADSTTATHMTYTADSVTARVMLKDIAQPFAPVLRNFSIPLNLRVSVSGTDQGMVFRGAYIDTDDRKLTISATGVLRNLQQARDLTLHFDVYNMVAKPGIKDKLINQFTVKKYMMNQVYALGVVNYHGSFDILWKKELFRGLLNTEMGDVDFNFELNEKTKYLTGSASTDSLKLGKLFQLERLGNIDCTANFCIDYSKIRTAAMRREKGGKLPIGSVQADIRKVQYRMITIRNIMADIQSDGALAQGDVTLKGSLTDLVLNFSFTNTTEMHKMKVKPRLKFPKIFGKKSDE